MAGAEAGLPTMTTRTRKEHCDVALESLGDFLLGEIVRNTAPAEAEDGDFRNEDGLLCCGVCGQQKECRTEIMGRIFTVPCLCKCGEDAYAKKEQDFKEEQRRIRISNMRVSGISDESLETITEAQLVYPE